MWATSCHLDAHGGETAGYLRWLAPAAINRRSVPTRPLPQYRHPEPNQSVLAPVEVSNRIAQAIFGETVGHGKRGSSMQGGQPSS